MRLKRFVTEQVMASQRANAVAALADCVAQALRKPFALQQA
jgi:hypothetical protein